MGDIGIAQGKGGTDALVQQVPGKNQTDLLLLQVSFFQKNVDCLIIGNGCI